MDYFSELQDAIRSLHGCESSHIKTVLVKEQFQGQVAWEGEVEVFSIAGHPRAKKCFAWSHRTGKDDQATRYVTILGVPPINSPIDAVRAAIIQGENTESCRTKGG